MAPSANGPVDDACFLDPATDHGVVEGERLESCPRTRVSMAASVTIGDRARATLLAVAIEATIMVILNSDKRS